MDAQAVALGLVRNSPDLASLPAVVVRLSEMLASGSYTASEVADIFGQDPALAARLLKVVNSPYYGYSGRVETVSRAVTLAGVDAIYGLVLTTTVLHGFRKIPSALVNMNDFWRHSVYCGELARMLAKEAAVLHSERLFIAGLLHRIGELVIYVRMPDKVREILLAAGGDDRLIPPLEEEMIGCSYVHVGAELARSWHLPAALGEAIRWQLEPESAGEFRLEAGLLNLAEQLKGVWMQGLAIKDVIDTLVEDSALGQRLSIAQILKVMTDLPEQMDKSASLFLDERSAGN